ncbi:hypothetical protein [Kitasatospora sp. NPDC048407]
MTDWLTRLWEVVQQAATTGYPVVAVAYYLICLTEMVYQHLQ